MGILLTGVKKKNKQAKKISDFSNEELEKQAGISGPAFQSAGAKNELARRKSKSGFESLRKEALAGLKQAGNISDVTRREITSGIEAETKAVAGFGFADFKKTDQSRRKLQELIGQTGEAQEGKSKKFKSRQAFQAQSDLLSDQPGRRQLLTSR